MIFIKVYYKVIIGLLYITLKLILITKIISIRVYYKIIIKLLYIILKPIINNLS